MKLNSMAIKANANAHNATYKHIVCTYICMHEQNYMNKCICMYDVGNIG